MSESISNIVDVIVNVSGGGISSPDLSIPCFFFGNASKESEKGLHVFSSSTEAEQTLTDKPNLIEALQAWEGLSSKPMLVFGYTEAAPAAAESATVKSSKKAVKAPSMTFKTTGNAAKDAIIKSRIEQRTAVLSDLKVAVEPTSFVEALTAARQVAWFYRPFLTEIQDADGNYVDMSPTVATDASAWCEANVARFDVTDSSDDALDPAITTDLISTLQLLPNRRVSANYSKNTTLSVRTGAVMSMTDYSAINGYRDSEFKKVGLSAEGLDPTAISTIKAKGGYLNISAQSVASETAGRLRNTMTFSQYTESISEVEAIDSLALTVQAEVDTTIETQDNLPQTYDGQQLLINQFGKSLQRYIDNGFCGERTVTHPVTKKEVLTSGYIMATEATDIDNLSQQERREYRAAPLVAYIYPAGSIHTVRITLNVMY